MAVPLLSSFRARELVETIILIQIDEFRSLIHRYNIVNLYDRYTTITCQMHLVSIF